MRRILYVIFIISSLLLYACQPTPQEEVIQNQQADYLFYVEQLAEGDSNSISDEPIQESNQMTEDLVVQFQANVILPETSQFDIAETKRRIFSAQELSQHMDDLLSENERLAELPKTKSYYAACASAYLEACAAKGMVPQQEIIDEYAKYTEEAPSVWEKKLFQISNLKTYDSFHVYAQNANGTYARFSGTVESSSFSYVRDESEGYIREDVLDPMCDLDLLKNYDVTFPNPDELLPKALAYLDLVGLSDMQLCSMEKIMVYRGNTPCECGWDFTFTHGTTGVPQLFRMESVAYGGKTAPLPTLVSPFGVEAAMISIGEKGELLCIDLRNIVEPPTVIMENVKLCDLDVVKQSILQHLKKTYSYTARQIDDSRIEVQQMQLCTALINVKDHYDLGRLIPAWYVKYQYIGKNNDGYTDSAGSYIPPTEFKEDYSLYFSALDGTFIEPRITRETYWESGYELD